MSLLDRFKFSSRTSPVSEDPPTFPMMDQVRDKATSTLAKNTANESLGILQHLLKITLSDENLRAYLMENKEAADLMLYCHHRFNGKRIPAELHYLHGRIVEVVQTYGSQIL